MHTPVHPHACRHFLCHTQSSVRTCGCTPVGAHPRVHTSVLTHLCAHPCPRVCVQEHLSIYVHTCAHTQSRVRARACTPAHKHRSAGDPCCHRRAFARSPFCTMFAHPLFSRSPPVCTSRFYIHPGFTQPIFTYTHYLHPPPCLYSPSTFPHPCCLHTRPCLHTPVFATPHFHTLPCLHTPPYLHTHPRCLHSQVLFPHSAPCFDTNTSRVSPLSPVCSPTRCLHSHPGVCTLAPPFPRTPCTLTPAPALPSPPELQLPSPPAPAVPRRPISALLVGRCRNGGAQALRAAPGRGEGRRDPAGPAGTGPRGAAGGSGATPSSPRPGEWEDSQLRPSEAAGPLPCAARPGQGSVPLALSCPSAG